MTAAGWAASGENPAVPTSSSRIVAAAMQAARLTTKKRPACLASARSSLAKVQRRFQAKLVTIATAKPQAAATRCWAQSASAMANAQMLTA